MVPDYGLSDLSVLCDEGEDEMNEATFGGGEGEDCLWGEEQSHELARLHEEFLREGAREGASGGFFGDALADGANDFMLEEAQPDEAALDPSEPFSEMHDDAEIASLDSTTLSMLESLRSTNTALPAGSAASNRGLHVEGLPSNLQEQEIKQLLSHFGSLSHFQMERREGGTSASIVYANPAITETACVNLNGIAIGAGLGLGFDHTSQAHLSTLLVGSKLKVQVVDLPPPATITSAAIPPDSVPLLPPSTLKRATLPAAPLMPTGMMDVSTLESRMRNAAARDASPGLQLERSAADAPQQTLPPQQHAVPADHVLQPMQLLQMGHPSQTCRTAPLQQPQMRPMMPPQPTGPPLPPNHPPAPPPPHLPQQAQHSQHPVQLGVDAQMQLLQRQMLHQFDVNKETALAQQTAHLPPKQRDMVMQQMAAQQQRIQQQLMAMEHQRAGPRIAQPPQRGMARVGERMNYQELQLIIKQQEMQLQIKDPIADDFYHHFWMVKGGRSQAKPLVGSTKPVVHTDRKANPLVSQSLGLGQVLSRAPDVSVRTPKPLLSVATDAPPPASEPPEGANEVMEGQPPLASRSWNLRSRIDSARQTLIELRVLASSPLVMTPEGQRKRGALLEKLFDLVQADNGGKLVEPALFNIEKGQKLLADLLPLWPQQMVFASLQSFVEQLPMSAKYQAATGRFLASSFANAATLLQPEQCLTLLRRFTAHGALTVKSVLPRADVLAVLLGLLSRSSDQALDDLASFYGLLMPLAATSEPAWPLLEAVLPHISAHHATIIQMAMGSLQPGSMTKACAEAQVAFREVLQRHIAPHH